MFFSVGGKRVLQVPALAIRVQSSDVKAELVDGQIQFGNWSAVGGVAMAFNLSAKTRASPQPLLTNLGRVEAVIFNPQATEF